MHRTHRVLLALVLAIVTALAIVQGARVEAQCAASVAGVVTDINQARSTFTIRAGGFPWATTRVQMSSNSQVLLGDANSETASVDALKVGDSVAARGTCLKNGSLLATEIRVSVRSDFAGAPGQPRGASQRVPSEQSAAGERPGTGLSVIPLRAPARGQILLDGTATDNSNRPIILGSDDNANRLTVTGDSARPDVTVLAKSGGALLNAEGSLPLGTGQEAGGQPDGTDVHVDSSDAGIDVVDVDVKANLDLQ